MSFIGASCISIVPSLALAAGGLVQIVPQSCNDKPGGCQSICAFAELAQNVLNDGIFFAIAVSAVLIAWSGGQYMIARGESYKIKDAKKRFEYIMIGLLLIMGAWLVVDTVMKTLTGGNAEFGPWNSIC